MTQANDPFDEYLKKKKVEMLEKSFRKDPSSDEEGEESVDPDEDPNVAAKVHEEMEEFFDAGGSAAADLFTKADKVGVEAVDEIRDALDEVFEDDAPKPEKESQEAFVSFFKQVKDEFDGGTPAKPSITVKDAPAAAAPPKAPAPVPPGAPAAPEVTAAMTPAVEEAPAGTEADSATVRAPLDDQSSTMDILGSEPNPFEVEDAPTSTATDLINPADTHKPLEFDLSELLAPPEDDDELKQRVDLLCRFVARLVERANLTDNEIVEVLIKSGVEF